MRHELNDPMQHDEQRLIGDLDKILHGRNRLIFHASQRDAERHRNENDADHIRPIAQRPQQALGEILHKKLQRR